MDPHGPPTFRLEHLLWAFQGLAAVLDPGIALEAQERAQLSMLLTLLTEQLESSLHAITAQHATLLAELQQARGCPPAPPRSPSPPEEPCHEL
jgi:hypothetical protein